MSTCNRLDLQTLGSQLTMPKNLPYQNLNVIHVEHGLQLSLSVTCNFYQEKGASMVTIICIIHVPRGVLLSVAMIPFRYDKMVVHNRHLKSRLNKLSLC